MIITDSFLKEIPKTDLHLHLDGSLRLTTLIELAQKNNDIFMSRLQRLTNK